MGRRSSVRIVDEPTVMPIGAAPLLSPLIGAVWRSAVPQDVAALRRFPQIASFFFIPWLIISTAKSTRRIELQATIPNSGRRR